MKPDSQLRGASEVPMQASRCRVGPQIYCNPCLGMPPMIVPWPERFLAIQLMIGLAALLTLILLASRSELATSGGMS